MQTAAQVQRTLELEAMAQAKAILDERRALKSLADFIPYVSPEFHRPDHLTRYVEQLERSRLEPIRICIAAPPRHGKSLTTLHFIVQELLIDPRATILYVTYAAEFALHQARIGSRIAQRAGLRLSDQKANLWTTEAGGSVDWQSIGGQITGKGFSKIIVDDPHKGRVEAESATIREGVHSWFSGDAFTRLDPGGSVVIMATRWHPDDLTGRQIAKGWPYINLPAIDAEGRPLFPERISLEMLEEIKEHSGPYDWSSLYQGEPRSRGGRVFHDPTWCEKLPGEAYRVRIGVDLAYTAKTHADYSAAVVLAEVGNDRSRHYVVLDVLRMQCEAPVFAEALAKLMNRYPGCRAVSHVATVEKGTIDLIRANHKVNVRAELAKGDKFVRAQPVAAAWNAGKVLVPRGAQWTDPFIKEVSSFTGLNDPHDDMVDALASAFFDFAGAPRDRIVSGGSW